ncbi:MAG: LamG domain-containing protein [Bacteroidales bacterium]
MKKYLLLFLMLASLLLKTHSQDPAGDLVAWWNFSGSQITPGDEAEDEEDWGTTTWERISGLEYRVEGLATFVPGVKGSAIKFDGFSSYVEGSPFQEKWNDMKDEDQEEFLEEFELPESISLEAWVALGAYPWNWAPILTIGRYKITGFYFGVDSRGCPGFHMSDATSVWHECNAPVDPETKAGMELRKWYHIVGTYDLRDGLAIYMNGELAGTYNDFQFDYGIIYSQIEEGFRMGMNRTELPPTDPIRDWATYPSRYSLDGIVDELKIHRGALTAGEVKKLYRSVRPENDPEFAPRKFPTVKPSGRFGANYTRLRYYPEWDALWPVGEYMDVVVQFDELPINTIFWRGTRYSACWVSENGKWMADQSRETGNNWFLSQGPREEMPTGCIEHMSDAQCRSSRVAIIESNDARAVVNWRYLQMDVKFRQKDLPSNTGFGEWGNELYYIYPDGVGVRKVLPGRGGWQETIFLNEPGTRPEDNIELEACRLMNLEGECKSYTWEHGYPDFDLEDAVIQVINFKSEYKPFLIFREGGGFEVFNMEVRPGYSHFPWWNHWPVAQIISDGRSAFAPDRAAHSSLSWGDPNGDAALYGMTDQGDQHIVALARSWNNPPNLRLEDGAWESEGYDYTQRAYMIRGNVAGGDLLFTLEASEKSPVHNPAFVITGWQEGRASLVMDGQEIQEGNAFRQGIEYEVDGSARLVVWIRKKTEKPVSFIFRSQ